MKTKNVVSSYNHLKTGKTWNEKLLFPGSYVPWFPSTRRILNASISFLVISLLLNLSACQKDFPIGPGKGRSEERRVGKEC